MIKVAKSWDDYLWSYIKTVLFYQVTESYIRDEEEYLEEFNLVYGDFHGSETTIKNEISNWDFPKSCPTDFDAILQETAEKMQNTNLCFPKRDKNPFYDIMMLLIQLQVKSSRGTETENRWSILVDRIYELNQVAPMHNEDIIFLGFSVHFLIVLYSMRRIVESKTEKFNELLTKFLILEHEIDSDKFAFYVNFLIGDDKKIDFFSGKIFDITDEIVQKRVLTNIDRHLPKLKQDIIDCIKHKMVEQEQSHSTKGSNITEVIQKLKFLYFEGNYTDFYRSVVEMARIFLINGFWRKADSLYRELSEELDHCEQIDNSFREHGFYKLLVTEHEKHMTLIYIQQESEMYENTNKQIFDGQMPPQSGTNNAKRRDRLIKKITSLLRDRGLNTVLFDYPLETEYDQTIKHAHSVLKTQYVPELVNSYFKFNYESGNFEDCLEIMDFILDGPPGTDDNMMQVDNSSNNTQLDLKPFMNPASTQKIDSNLADVMMQTSEVVINLLT